MIVVDAEAFNRLCDGDQPDFIEFLSTGPDISELDLERDRTPMRDLDL